MICIRDNITWLNERELIQDRLRESKYSLTDVAVQVSIKDQPAQVSIKDQPAQVSIKDQPVAETELNLVITEESSATEDNKFCMV